MADELLIENEKSQYKRGINAKTKSMRVVTVIQFVNLNETIM